MAINDDNLERDPRLSRLVQAAAGQEPPAALDAAILAAARREVGARPQVVGGGGETSSPPARARRNWYVPVSIAAVVVMSVSLVTLVHEEKGDELAQPPRSVSAPPKVSAPAPAAQAPAAAPPAPAKADVALRDAAPAKPKVADEKRAEAATAPEAYGELAKKQRMQSDKIQSKPDLGMAPPGTARKDQDIGVAKREQAPAREVVAAPSAQARRDTQVAGPQDRAFAETRREAEASGRLAQERPRSATGIRGYDGATVGGASGASSASAGTAAPPPPPQESKVSPEPFPAQASRDAAEARTRSEADRNVASGAIRAAPTAPMVPMAPPAASAPPAPIVTAPRRAASPTEDAQPPSASPSTESRGGLAAPPQPSSTAKLATPSASKSAARPMEKRPPLWLGLEDQPPGKWLERLAEFKRDGRQADADELLAEFRRRFPEHPASAR